MNDQTSATSSPPRFRFLSAKRHALPKSILFFGGCLALVLSLISTLALLRFALPRNPALESIVIAVPEYQSIDITANPFAVADAKSMERALGSKASLLTPKDLSDLEQSLTFEPKNRRAPLVVYIDMASTSSGEQGYLLTTDAKSLNVNNAYSIRNLLEKIWQIPVPHKLLILNTNHRSRNLRAGILDNDFSSFLKAEFNALTKRANNTAETAGVSNNNTIQSNFGSDSTKSFMVLCSSADGQSNWGSPSLGYTPFAALVSYCISGGEKADRLSMPGGKSDGFISVSELSLFVIEQTACWSIINRQTPQTPIVLHYGEDFPIATVNPWHESDLASSNLKVDNSATASPDASNKQQKNTNKVPEKDSSQGSPTSNDPKAATADVKKDSQDGKADATVKSPSPATGASSSETEMAGLLNRLMLLWQQQHDLQGNPSTRWHPNNWSAVQQLLIEAEGNLIAGDSAICQQRLEQAEAILNQLESWQPTNLQWDWSIIFADRTDAPAHLIAEKKLIEAFLAKPTPAAVEKIVEPQSVEGQLLVSLARQHSIDWVVKEVSVVRLAIENKSLAAEVASHREPLVNRVVLPYLKEADRQSRQGQVHLFATRIPEATDAFRKARVEYRRTIQLSDIIAKQLATVESTLVTLPFYIDWIGNLPTTSPPHDSCVKSLQLLMENFHAFQASPQTNQLELLEAICIDFTQLLEDHVIHELSSGDYRTIRTALRLPTIGVDERRNALEFVLSRKDEPVPIDGAVAPLDTFSTNPSGHSFPLSAFFSFFNQLQPHVQVPLDFLESLPESGSQDLPPIKANSPQLSRLNQIFRQFLRETEKPSSKASTKATPWQQHWQTLVLAYWLNQPTMNPRVADSESKQIYQAALTRSLKQAYERLVEDSRYLPKGTYDDSLSSMARLLARDSNQFHRDFMPPVQLVSSTEIQLSGSGPNTVPIEVLLPDHIPDGEVARLRLNWDDEKLALELSNAVIIPGQMTIDLGTVAAGQLLSIQPTIIEKEPAAASTVHEIIVSIQFMKPESNSSIREISHVKWLPKVTITAEDIPQKRADLIISWNDKGATPNQVDLLPNQAITLNLSVQPNVTEPLTLTLKARGQTEILGTVAIKDGKRSPIKPQEGPGFVINEAAVTFELYENDNLVDEETVAVSILDLDDCLQRQVTFNPQQRTVTASLQQTQFSDSLAPIHFQLGTTEGETIPGRLSLSLEPEHNTGSMDAQFARSTLLPTDVSISASGVPRLFRYSVYPELVNCPPQRELVLYWDTPTPKTAFQFKAGQQMLLPIVAQIDGPRNLNIQMGFDQNNNTILEQNEVQLNEELWFGRIVKSQLVPTKDGFSVVSNVTDVATTLDVSGLAGRQNLITRATCDDDQCQETVPLYFIDSAPQVAIVEPAEGAAIAPGSDIHVVLQGQENSAGAINHVDFGFDMNNNDVLDKNEMVKPIDVSQGPISFDKFSQLSVHLPTKGLKPGESNLLVQTQTLVHDLSEPDKKPELLLGNVLNRTIEISDTGSLVGRVSTADGVPTENAIVTVVGYPSQLTGKDGAFEFLGLPPGKHVIAAETSIRSVAAIAEVKAGETSSVALQLRLK